MIVENINSVTDSHVALFDASAGRLKDGGALPAAGTTQLPAWTFDSGTGGNPSAGKFQLDNPSPISAGNVYFNYSSKNGGLLNYLFLLTFVGSASGIILTDNIGKSYVFRIVSISSGGSVVTMAVGSLVADSAALSGDYTLSFCYSNQLASESGWGTPSSAGNKATVLTNYDTAGLAAAAALVGLGDTNTQVGELTDVLQALITYLRAKGVLTS